MTVYTCMLVSKNACAHYSQKQDNIITKGLEAFTNYTLCGVLDI